MQIKKYFVALMSVSLLAYNFVMTANAMGKVDPSKVVNGAQKPAKGVARVANRTAKLVGSGTRVGTHIVGGAATGATKFVAGAVANPIVGSIIKGTPVQIKSEVVIGAAAIGAGVGGCKGYKTGREDARYPKK